MPRDLASVDSRAVASTEAEVDAFLAKAKSMPRAGAGRLIFALDATMSRQPTWDRAQSIQGQMFVEAAKSGELAVQLAYFRGFNECKASKWVSNGNALAQLMSKIDCRGGNTQIGKMLRHIGGEIAKAPVSAAVFIGDAMEENVDALCTAAGEIGMLGTPIFMFQEGRDAETERAFREIARLTNGAYFRLDGTSAAQLAQVLSAVAAYAAGGLKALKDNAASNPAARHLLPQMKK